MTPLNTVHMKQTVFLQIKYEKSIILTISLLILVYYNDGNRFINNYGCGGLYKILSWFLFWIMVSKLLCYSRLGVIMMHGLL